MSASGPLFFEDLHEGMRFRSGAILLSRDGITAFAAEFDPQPQHVGEAEAKASLFGTLIASGWHTGAVTMRLQYEAFFSRFPGGAMGAQVENLAWKRPVHPGDTLHAEMEVLGLRESRSRPGSGVVQVRTTTLNQRDEVVMEMSAHVLVPRRPGPGDGTQV